ncbi:hypothetical protein K474DRAFT_1667001 [Panus rudis PR-1116 ss-1]|nr:hypothetical protein K474DRAFT_1667001 [Panus rudis PR-1116 ss-1]
MIHSLLSSLPDLYEDEEAQPTKEDEEAQPTKEDVYEPLEPPRSKPVPSETGEEYPSESPESSRQHDDETVVAETAISSDVDQSQLDTLVEIDPALSTKEEKLPNSLHEHETEPSTHTSATSQETNAPPATQSPSDTVSDSSYASHAPTSRPLTPTSRPTTPLVAEPEPDPISHRPRISLSSLLQHADTLHTLYPPTHPSIALDTIMGPQSVTRTWSEKTDEMPADDEAEKMVSRMDLIVFPAPPEEFTKEKEEGDGDYETEEEGRTKEKKRRRRKLQKTPRAYTRHIIPIRRKTMVASAVLVLGVAVAVYGTGGLRGLSGGDGRGHGQGHRELRSIGRFVGALLVGAGERLLDSIWG